MDCTCVSIRSYPSIDCPVHTPAAADTHTHECRRCGSEIECRGECITDQVGYCWEGDNVGCPNEKQENLAELAAARNQREAS